MKNKSHASFIPAYFVFLSLLIFFGKRSFEDVIAAPIDLLNIHKVASLIAALFFIANVYLKKKIPDCLPAALKFYFFYICVGMVSSLFFSPWKLFSLWKLLEVFTVFSVSVYISDRSRHAPECAFNFYELNISFFRWLIYTVLIGAIIAPSQAIRLPISEAGEIAFGTPIFPYQIFGLMPAINANSVGAISAILFYIELIRLIFNGKKWKVLKLAQIALFGSMLLLAQSRTAWIAFVIAIAFGVSINRKYGIFLFFGLIFLFAGAYFFASGQIFQYLTRGVPLAGIFTLSGRLSFWDVALSNFDSSGMARQLFGMGYMAANRFILANDLDSSGIATLHSDYIDALISTGWIGCGSLVLSIFLAFVSVTKKFKFSPLLSYQIEMIGILIILGIRSFTGTTFAAHNFFLFLFLIICICGFVGRQKSRSFINQRGCM